LFGNQKTGLNFILIFQRSTKNCICFNRQWCFDLLQLYESSFPNRYMWNWRPGV